MVVFVVGEMLWVPTSQAIAAELAPEDLRGAYMGAFNSTGSLGFALGPFIGLQLLDITEPETSDGSAWYFFAGISVAAAIAGAVAVRGASTRRREAVATV
jgi:MFS family permease